ncbi:hypothetical protein HDU76_012317, partial [Blyttiomyces sp. JEL0837]
IADLIQEIPLSLEDRYTLVASPTNADDTFLAPITLKYAKAISEGEEVTVREVVGENVGMSGNRQMKLREFEGAHKAIILYLWLAFRFPTIFTDVDTASHLKRQTENMINEILDSMHDPRIEKRISRRLKQEGKK